MYWPSGSVGKAWYWVAFHEEELQLKWHRIVVENMIKHVVLYTLEYKCQTFTAHVTWREIKIPHFKCSCWPQNYSNLHFDVCINDENKRRWHPMIIFHRCLKQLNTVKIWSRIYAIDVGKLVFFKANEYVTLLCSDIAFVAKFEKKPASLTHWGRVTHIYVGNLTIIGSDSGLSTDRHQANIWSDLTVEYC